MSEESDVFLSADEDTLESKGFNRNSNVLNFESGCFESERDDKAKDVFHSKEKVKVVKEIVKKKRKVKAKKLDKFSDVSDNVSFNYNFCFFAVID